MNDLLVALVAGGFALGGATLTFIGTSWVRVQDRAHERNLQRQLIESEHRAKDIEEVRRLKRQNLQPIFDVLEEMDRFLANRLWVGAYEKLSFDALPEESKQIAVDPETWDAIRARLKERAEKGLELGPEWRSLGIRAAWTALRIEGDADLQTLLVVTAEQIAQSDIDVARVGQGLVEFRRRFLQYAAKAETGA